MEVMMPEIDIENIETCTLRYGDRVEGDRRKNVCVTLRASVHAALRDLAETRGRSASSIIESLIEEEARDAA